MDELVTVVYEVNGVTVYGEVLQHEEHLYVYAALYRLPEGKGGEPFASVPFAGTTDASDYIEQEVKRHDGGYYDLTDWKDKVDWSMEHEGWRDEVYAPYDEQERTWLGLDEQPDKDSEDVEIPPDLHGGHVGFWTDVDGEPIHILGDPNMSEETLKALQDMARLVRKMQDDAHEDENEQVTPCPLCGSPLSYYSMVRFVECTNPTCDYKRS